MNFLKRLFAPPIFEDEIKTQQAYILNVILWTLVCVPIPFILYTLTLRPENTNRVLAQAIFGETVNIILLIMLRRGYVRFASIIQVGAFWLFFTATASTGNAIQSEAYLIGYTLVIAIAGILLGGRGALIFTLLSLAAGGLMVYGQVRGILRVDAFDTPLNTWIVSLVLFPVGAVLQYLASHAIRQALARARVSEERYRVISEITSDYTFSTALDAQGKMKLEWVAGAFESITGYTYQDYVAAGGWLAHLHPGDVEQDKQDMQTLRENKLVTTEVRTYKKDGELRWVRVYGHPVWDEKQYCLVGIMGAVQDITAQKQAEEALRESEAIYRQAIEVAGAVPYHQTYLDNSKVIYDFVGEGIRQITGYGPEEFNEALWDSLMQERILLEDLAAYSFDEAILKVRSGENPIWKCEHCIKARDGKIHWVFEASVELRDENGISHGSIGLFQDITERKKAEEALKVERDLLQLFIDNIPDTVYFKDAESRFVRINKTQARFLKLDNPQEAVGKTDLDFQSSELAQQFMEEEKRIIATGEPVINRIEFNPTEDGKPRWLSATKVPVKDSTGRTLGTIGISRDVTDQKLAEERELRRRATLEQVIRVGKKVTEVSDLKTTLEKIWHSVRDDLGFDRMAIFLHNPQRNTMDGSIGTDDLGQMIDESHNSFPIDEGDIESNDFKRVLGTPDGLYFTHNYDVEHNIQPGNEMYGVKDFVSVAAWAGDKPIAVICGDNLLTGRPITDEQLESLRLFAGYAALAIENAHLNDALQNELAQRQALINELEDKNAELERFTYTVSHDLKSPLVTITGFLGFLEKDALAGNIDKMKSSLDRISNAAQKMQLLLNDLLELSRVGRLMNPPVDVPFNDIVQESLELVQGQLEARKIEVKVQENMPTVRVDRVRLVEVLQNLIENAIKFMNSKPDPLIEIGVHGRDKNGLTIYFVRDNGIGIDPQFHKKIFGLFDKLDARTEGTGIGLSLVKRIIEVHQGNIWVESELDKGATFYFTLPDALKKE